VGEGGLRGGTARCVEQTAETAHEGGPKGCRWGCQEDREESCEQEACGQKIRRQKETRTNQGTAKRLIVVTGSP